MTLLVLLRNHQSSGGVIPPPDPGDSTVTVGHGIYPLGRRNPSRRMSFGFRWRLVRAWRLATA